MQNNSTENYIAEEVYAEIGKIAVIWSKIETNMEFLILDIQEIAHESGLVITSELSYRPKHNLLQTFINDSLDKKNPKHIEAFELLKDIDKANTIRNKALHHIWGATSDPLKTTRMTIRAKGKLDSSIITIDYEELINTTDYLLDVGKKLAAFRESDWLRKNSG